MLFAVPAQGFLAGSFGGAGLRKGTHAFLGCYGLRGGGAALAREGRFLAGGEIDWHQHSISLSHRGAIMAFSGGVQ